MKRTGITSILIVLLALFGCGEGGQEGGEGGASGRSGPRTITVETASARVQTVKNTINVVGSLKARNRTVVSPEISGIVEEIKFKEGDTIPEQLDGRDTRPVLVTLEDDLLQMDVRNAEAQLDARKADLAKARDDFERKEIMNEKGATTEAAFTRAKIEMNRAKAAVQEAKARLEQGKERLSKATIRAPIPGELGERQVSPGTYVRPGDPLVEIVQFHPIEITFDVPARYRDRLKPGLSVEVQVDAYPEKTFEGEVFYIGPSVNRETRTITVKGRISNEERVLKPGMFARVRLVVETREQSVVIPDVAVVPRDDQFFVYTMKNGKARKNRVELGQRMAGEIEILNGLTGKETVITAGLQMVSDGVPVRDRSEESSKETPSGEKSEN